MQRLLRVLLSCLLALGLILASGCSTTPVQTPPGLRAKPTTCLLQVPQRLPYLPAEWSQLTLERVELETKPVPTPADADRAAAIDQRLAQLLLDLHRQDGTLYETAVAELQDCQGWIHDQP